MKFQFRLLIITSLLFFFSYGYSQQNDNDKIDDKDKKVIIEKDKKDAAVKDKKVLTDKEKKDIADKEKTEKEKKEAAEKEKKQAEKNAEIKKADKKQDTAADKPGPDRGKGRHLGNIVITSTKTAKTVGTSPGNVSVITSEDIENQHIQLSDQAVAKTEGVFLKRAKMTDSGSPTTISIRGFSGSSRNLVMLDGMPINDAYSSTVDYTSIAPDTIERVEVVKGPFSSLYGRNAQGGVINFITKSTDKKDVTAMLTYGSFNTFSAHAHVADKFFDKFGIFLSFDYRSTDGDRSDLVIPTTSFSMFTPSAAGTPVTGANKVTGANGNDFNGTKPYFVIGDSGQNYMNTWITSGKLSYDFTKTTSLMFSYNIQQYDFGYKNPQSYLHDAAGNAVTEGTVNITYNGTQYTKDLKNGSEFLGAFGSKFLMYYMLDFKTKFDDMDFKIKAGLNESQSWYSSAQPGALTTTVPTGKTNYTYPSRTISSDIQLDIPLNFGASFMEKKHVLTVGIAERYDYSKSQQWTTSDWKNPLAAWNSREDDMEGNQIFASLYTQFEFGLVKDYLSIFAGARYDHWVNWNGYTYSRSPAIETSYPIVNDFQVSPKIALVFKPNLVLGDKVFSFDTVKASYGLAFNPPNINNLYKKVTYGSTTYYPNPDLKPESSQSWDAGLNFSFFKKVVTFSASYFGSVITNFIQTQTLTTTSKQYMNVSEGTIHGFEGEMRVYILDLFEVFANYTYTWTQITKSLNAVEVGSQFQTVPLNMANAGLVAHTKYISGSFTFRFADKTFGEIPNTDIARNTYGTYDQIMLLDLKITGKPYEGVSLSFGIDNLLDTQYYQYYKSPGRTFYGELKVKI